MAQFKDSTAETAFWLGQQARSGLSSLRDLVFPPRSLLTGRPSSTSGIDAELWARLRFLDEPCCARCGYPFDYALPEGSECAACTARPPHFDRLRSAFAYNDDSAPMVLRFKHGGQMDGLPVFARHMQRAGREILASADMLVPVPLHPKRLRARKYNQAALLARALSKASSAPVDYGLLLRVKNTASQGHMRAAARRRNIAGAFAVPDARRDAVEGQHICLIDDVFTTGATLSACARVLKKAGAAQISALCLARVVRPQSPELK